MNEIKQILDRLAAFTHDVFVEVLHLPNKAADLAASVAGAAFEGLQVGAIAGLITHLATGLPFTSFLVGGLWTAAFAAYRLLTRLGRSESPEE